MSARAGLQWGAPRRETSRLQSDSATRRRTTRRSCDCGPTADPTTEKICVAPFCNRNCDLLRVRTACTSNPCPARHPQRGPAERTGGNFSGPAVLCGSVREDSLESGHHTDVRSAYCRWFGQPQMPSLRNSTRKPLCSTQAVSPEDRHSKLSTECTTEATRDSLGMCTGHSS